jgi:hypothetical protein
LSIASASNRPSTSNCRTQIWSRVGAGRGRPKRSLEADEVAPGDVQVDHRACDHDPDEHGRDAGSRAR